MKRYKSLTRCSFALILVVALLATAFPQSHQANTESVAQIIEQETQAETSVTIGGEQYAIVSLKSYIAPQTLKCSATSKTVKVYVDSEGNPISQLEIAQKIGVIDSAQRWIGGVGSDSEISRNIELIDHRWKLHRMIKVGKLLSDVLANALADAIRAYITAGTSIPEDVISGTVDLAKNLTVDPENIIALIIYEDFSQAKKEYQEALGIAESGAISDYETASAYFEHYFTAYANNYPAWHLLDKIDEIEKTISDELKDFGKEVADELTGGYYGKFEDFVGGVRDLLNTWGYFGEKDQALSFKTKMLSEPNYHARYTLALAQGGGEVGDVIPPATYLISPPSGTIYTNKPTFTWTASDDVTPAAELIYSYYLEGYDSGWSDWTSATSKEYTGLSSGNYTFKVKAKDEAGNIAPTPAESSFRVSGILIEGADSVREFDMKPSIDLADSTSNVVPRILTEYANSTRHYDLAAPSDEFTDLASQVSPRVILEYANSTRHYDLAELPAELTDLASQVSPRVMLEYANSTYHYNLAEPPAGLANLTSQVPPRLILEYANSNSCFDLAFPRELINDTVPPSITNVAVINITADSATIMWETDEFATSLVKYGKEAGVYTDTATNPLFVKAHQVKLTDLAPDTYYFVVAGTDQSSNFSQSIEFRFREGTITGIVKLQGSENFSEVNISINDLNINPDSEGNFSIQVASGTYTVGVSKSGYLSAQQKGVIVEAGETTPLPEVTLLGGDADNDGLIDAEDLNLISSQFNSDDIEADINGDGIVDVYNLSLAGINFGKEKSPWLPG